MDAAKTDLSDDYMAVIEAANVLGLREIDLFRLAYEFRWGRTIEPGRLERIFADYMLYQDVPYWLGRFSHDVVNRPDGMPERVRAGVRHYRPKPREKPRHGGLVVASVMALLVVYCLWLVELSYDPGTSAPLPCHAGPGFRVMTDLARALGGTPALPCPDAGRVNAPPAPAPR